MVTEVFCPVMGNQEMVNRFRDTTAKNASDDAQITIIDNAPNLMLDITMRTVIMPDNLGMIKSLQWAKENSTAEFLVYTHSDFLIYDVCWDKRIESYFRRIPELGLVGAVGGRWAADNGGRGDVFCSFRNGDAHGVKSPIGLTYVSLLDGCFMFFRRTCLDSFEIDKTFMPHHFYDKDWSIEAITRGWKVGVVDLECDHLGGQSTIKAGNEYEKWITKHTKSLGFGEELGDLVSYRHNEERYRDKWRRLLPIYVDAGGKATTRHGTKDQRDIEINPLGVGRA